MFVLPPPIPRGVSMRRLALGLALIGAFLAGGVLMNRMVLLAEDKPEPKPRGQLYFKWRELGLNKEQIEKIYRIQSEHRAQIDKLEGEIKKLKAQERTKAEALLTPAQKQRLKELLSGETAPEKDKPADKAKP